MRKTTAWVLMMLFFLPGCASKGGTEERLEALELAVSEARLNDARLALLEDRVNSLSADVAYVRGTGVPQASDSQAKTSRVKTAQPRSAAPQPAAAAFEKPAAAAASAASSRPAKGEQGEYARALAAFEAGKSQEAQALFTAFLDAYPSSGLAPNAGYWLGECEYSLKHYDKAILAFKNVVGKYPKHPKAAASMLKAGYAYERLGDKENARFYLSALVEDFPKSEPAGLARKKLAAL